MITKVIIRSQKSYILSEVEDHIRQIFTELGIYDKLKDKKRILIKPNLLGAHHPDKAVTTHPVVIEAVIRILQENPVEIVIGDSPGGTVSINHVWQETGIKELCEKYNVDLAEFGKEGIETVNMESVPPLYIDKNVMNCDAVINMAKMKTHSMMLYTGAVKNLYGVIPGLYKSELHKLHPSPNDFSNILVAVYNLLKPKIVVNIIDGIIGMDGEGPSAGNPYPYHIILASEKASAVDFLASKMMGLKQIPYLEQCLCSDNITYDNIESDTQWQNFIFKNVKLKGVLFKNKVLILLPEFVKKIFRKLFAYYPAFYQKCKLCNICVKCCPVNALKVENKKILLDKKKCIKCLCCHEMCPHSAVYLKKSLLASLIFN